MESDYSKLLTKEDWEVAKKQLEAMRINGIMNLHYYEVAIKQCDDKIAEFKDEVDKVVEEVTNAG